MCFLLDNTRDVLLRASQRWVLGSWRCKHRSHLWKCCRGSGTAQGCPAVPARPDITSCSQPAPPCHTIPAARHMMCICWMLLVRIGKERSKQPGLSQRTPPQGERQPLGGTVVKSLPNGSSQNELLLPASHNTAVFSNRQALSHHNTQPATPQRSSSAGGVSPAQAAVPIPSPRVAQGPVWVMPCSIPHPHRGCGPASFYPQHFICLLGTSPSTRTAQEQTSHLWSQQDRQTRLLYARGVGG